MIRLKLTDEEGRRIQALLIASGDSADATLLREIRDQIDYDARCSPDDEEEER